MSFQILFKSAAVALIGSVSLVSSAQVAPVQAASVNFSDTNVWQDFGNVVINPNSNQAIILADAPDNGISALITAVNAGDSLSFDWSFLPDPANSTNALTSFNGVPTILGSTFGSGSFTQTFLADGFFGVGFVGSASDSVLALNNAQFTAVPTPALLPGLIGLGLTAMRQRKREAA